MSLLKKSVFLISSLRRSSRLTFLVLVATYVQLTYSNTMTNADGTIELIHGQGEPTHAIIWLHGLGATANDFPPIVPQLGLAADRTIRFIFPQAPDRPITINGGMRMPGWYDIKGLSIADKQDAVGMAESQETLNKIIASQVQAGIASNRIIVAGFSQGGAVAYFTAVRSEHTLAGVLALSTYLPFAENTQSEQTAKNIATPFLANHGTFDPVVPIELGKTSVDVLQELGYEIEWKTYSMEHNVVPEQIRNIGNWIDTVFSAAN